MVSLRRKNKEASFREKRKIFSEDHTENGGISFSKVNVSRTLCQLAHTPPSRPAA